MIFGEGHMKTFSFESALRAKEARMPATSPDSYGVRGATELPTPQTPAEMRKLIDDVVKANGDDGAKAVRTLGAAILQSAKIFDARCEDVARLMNEAAARLAAQAELIMKMIHEATTMVEGMQRKAVGTAQLVANNEAVPDEEASGGTSIEAPSLVECDLTEQHDEPRPVW
jgi:hypothetical protein